MKLSFLGAAREVTGSCYLLQAADKKILIDCGMEQGPDIYENQKLSIKASELDAVILTHAHIDHSGMLPKLVKDGYKGKIYMTRASRDLCKIMLMDSAGIQEFEAEWRKRKAKRGEKEYEYEPIYTSADVEKTIKTFRACDYHSPLQLLKSFKIEFIDAGHILGSASLKITVTENGEKTEIVFSGDIGNKDKPIIRNPEFYTSADYVVMESTYGDRDNERGVDYSRELADIIQITFDRGGNVVIPSFAVGRMQELLYFIRKIKQENMVKGHGNFPVYVDSPLAIEATEVFEKNLCTCYDEQTKKLVEQGINPIGFKGLITTTTTAESIGINEDTVPKVILSASGMCEAGRIRHHLKHNLWRYNSAVVFVGYQVQGTLGRMLLDGAKKVKLFGEIIDVNARIYRLRGTSSHADKSGLLEWVSNFKTKPKRIFVTHGEDTVAEGFANTLIAEQGQTAVAPYPGSVWNLTENSCEFLGNTVKKSRAATDIPYKPSPTYMELLAAMQRLNGVIKNLSGGANADLRRLSAEIDRLSEEYKI